MKLSTTLRFALAVLVASASLTALAEERPNGHDGERPQTEQQQQAPGSGVLRLLPGDSVTEHTIDTPKGKLAYTATAGTLAFYNQSGERSASIFYTAYVVKNAASGRPITFAFNGGPGAASAFLHLGLVGPRILEFGPGARDAAQAKLTDNPNTWLAFTDLVLIDPVGTGWSRAAKQDDAKNFWSIESDANAMAKAIALYIGKNDRAGAPKYLLGESYGGFRAAKTARALVREQGIAVNGIVMMSPFLEGWLTFGNEKSALRAALELPSLAAAELERKNNLNPQTLAAAEKFAATDYLTTLAGPAPQGEAAKAFYARVAQVSGLPVEAVAEARGFVTDAYIKRLREGKIVSRYDATFAVDDPFPEQRGSHAPDPVLDGVSRAYGGAFAAYARNELSFKTEMTYALLANDVTRHWDWQGGRGQASADDELRVLLSFSPSFRLLIGHGYADMVTPYAMSRYVLDKLPPSDPPGRAQLKLYRGGHMFYLDAAARQAFSNDVASFYRGE
jgi:carboxypeptidase C (cathepsin A)